MRSIIISRGQTVIPSAIRRQFHLTPADGLEWIVEGDEIRVFPVRRNPINAFRGQGRGGANRRLLADRRHDRKRELRRFLMSQISGRTSGCQISKNNGR